MSAPPPDHADAGEPNRAPPPAPDLDQVRAFLGMLNADGAEFTFQTFDDSELGRGDLAKVVHGTLDEQHARLAAWNSRGAGIFACVNETDGMGRKSVNVVRVRAVFVDLDGAPLRPVMICGLEPHIVVESSPGRWHCYWLVDGLALDQFKDVQRAIAARFGGDASVNDLPRVMRLPGYAHMKAAPFMVNIQGLSDRPPYSAEQIMAEFLPATRAAQANGHDQGNGFDRDMAELARRILTGEEYHDALRDLAWRYLSAGMAPGQVVETLRGLMDATPDEARDSRWTARRAEIPRLVTGAQEKLTPHPAQALLDKISGAQQGQQEQPTPTSPEPVDIIGDPALVGWPELTTECVPDAIFNYVSAEAARLNVDPVPIAVHVLAACATSISDAWRFKPKMHDPWTQQARIWACVVKEVGARGTEMIRSAFFPIREVEKEMREEWAKKHNEWEERQRAWKANCKKGDPKTDPDDPEPEFKRLTTQDATVEAASQILAAGDEHSKLTILCDELVSFLGSFNRYSDKGSSARALWLEGYDGGPQQIDRIIRGHVFVPNWSIVVVGNIQPRRLARIAKDLIDDGLFQRFLTVHTKPSPMGVEDDRPFQIEAGREYRELHEHLAGLMPAKGALGNLMPAYASNEARDVRRTFMRLVERLQADSTLPNLIRESASKWSGLLARISLLFHLIECAERARQGEALEGRALHEVPGPTVTKAATFVRRIVLPNLFRLAFETTPEEGTVHSHARWLAGYILAHQSEAITAREIGRAYRPLRGQAEEIGKAMAVLVDAGWAREAPGRQYDSTKWEINPAVHTTFAVAAAHEKERRDRVTAALKQRVADL